MQESKISKPFNAPIYKLRNKIDDDFADIPEINENPYAIDFLIENLQYIIPDLLSENESEQVPFLFPFMDVENLDYDFICGNSSGWAADLILKNKEKIIWRYLLKNPNDRIVDFILANTETDCILTETIANIEFLCSNPNDRIIDYLIENKEKITCYNNFIVKNTNERAYLLLNKDKLINNGSLFANPANWAVDLIFEILADKKTDIDFLISDDREVDFYSLNLNSNDRIIDFLEANPKFIRRNICFNRNPRAKKLDKKKIINYKDPEFFMLDYKKMKKNMHQLKKEIVEKAMDPKRIQKIINLEKERLGLNPDDERETMDIETLI